MKATKNITYKKDSANPRHLLDVYRPSGEGRFPVMLFIHGGSWYQGSKDLYAPLGEQLAGKGIVAVICNYRLGGEADYEAMAEDCSAAMRWVTAHIGHYGGDAERIFISGHSAGGHLAALLSLNKRFLGTAFLRHHLRGCILIDAFGLNIDYVMKNNQWFFAEELKKVFTSDPEKWRDAAPVNFITQTELPFLMLTGAETYPYLSMDNALFAMGLQAAGVEFAQFTLPGKNHREMVMDLQHTDDKSYAYILKFIQAGNLGQKAA